MVWTVELDAVAKVDEGNVDLGDKATAVLEREWLAVKAKPSVV